MGKCGFLTHHEAKDHSGEEAADEAFPGLLRGELQEGGHTHTEEAFQHPPLRHVTRVTS